MIRKVSWLFAFGGALAFATTSCSTTDEAKDAAGGPIATDKPCSADAQCTVGSELCDTKAGSCVILPPGGEIGYRDGTSSSVALTEIYAVEGRPQLIDLAFNPSVPNELWVVAYGDNSVHVGNDVQSPEATWQRYLDPAARHFGYRPPAIAMGQAPFWALCGDNDNAQSAADPNADGAANFFMGPAMFTTDRTIFAKRTPTGLGSHYDMLHSTPFCRGIAHVEKNVYWVFNAHDQALDKYDFAEDHGPGNDDHSDGTIYRYAAGQVKGYDGVSSHVFYDPSDRFLYVADTGNERIVRLDTTKGTLGGALPRRNEPLAGNGMMEGTDVEVVVPASVIPTPSGIEVKGELIYVSDATTSTFHVFDKSGKELRKLATGLPEGSLSGFTFGPDGKIWFTDRVAGKVLRIDPL